MCVCKQLLTNLHVCGCVSVHACLFVVDVDGLQKLYFIKLNISLPRCEVDMWPESFPIPREQMLKKIQGKDAIFCLLTEKIDTEVLNAAGKA